MPRPMKNDAKPCPMLDPNRRLNPPNREAALCLQLHDLVLVAAASAQVEPGGLTKSHARRFDAALSPIEAFIANYRRDTMREPEDDGDKEPGPRV